MYAIIETGGKQYRVEVGTELQVELLDAKAGDTITLERVLLVADGDAAAIGRPVVADASVSAEVVRQERGDKVIAFKYRPKARRRVKRGHRQELHLLRIADIVLNGRSAAAALKKAESDAKTERQRLEEAARRQAAEDAALAAKLAAAKAKAGAEKAKDDAGAAKPETRPAKRGTATKPEAQPAKRGTAAEPKPTARRQAQGARPATRRPAARTRPAEGLAEGERGPAVEGPTEVQADASTSKRRSRAAKPAADTPISPKKTGASDRDE